MKKGHPSPLPLPRRPFLVLSLVGSFLAGYLASESTHLFEAPLPVAPIEASTVRVCFSPQGGCEARIIQEIKRAQKEILVQVATPTVNIDDIRRILCGLCSCPCGE